MNAIFTPIFLTLIDSNTLQGVGLGAYCGQRRIGFSSGNTPQDRRL